MADVTQTGSGRDLGRGDLAQLLLLKETALDLRIQADIAELSTTEQRRVVWAMVAPDLSWRERLVDHLKRWIELKKGVLGFPGRAAAGVARRYSKNGGRDFCERIDYCRRKADIREKLGIISGMETETSLAADEALERIDEAAPELMDFAEEAFDLLSEAIADYVIPGSILIKVIKYGLDDLCPCCEACGGTGRSEGAGCSVCSGDGLRVPFPS